MLRRFLRVATNIGPVHLLFQVICLIGLSWQVFEISTEHLKYKVSCRTTVFIPEDIEDLSMGICLPIFYATDYQKLKTGLQNKWMLFENLSINEIYNYTYDADNILNEGGYWKDIQSKSTNLLSIMKMEKYVYNGKICYLYSVKSFKTLSMFELEGGMVAHLAFGKEISKASDVALFIAEKDRIPFRETIRARRTFRGSSSMKLDTFQSSHYSIRKQLLPPPYETACFSYSKLNFTNRIECIQQCVILKWFHKWGAISSRSLVPNKLHDYKFVKSGNYKSKKAEKEKIHLSCQSSCPKTSCEDTHIVTIPESAAHTGWDSFFKSNISIIWERQIPSIPSAIISCRATSTLTELILYIMSSASTWTGLSMMSINPMLVFRKLSKRKLENEISPLQTSSTS